MVHEKPGIYVDRNSIERLIGYTIVTQDEGSQQTYSIDEQGQLLRNKKPLGYLCNIAGIIPRSLGHATARTLNAEESMFDSFVFSHPHQPKVGRHLAMTYFLGNRVHKILTGKIKTITHTTSP
jgi:hypothetical protein